MGTADYYVDIYTAKPFNPLSRIIYGALQAIANSLDYASEINNKVTILNILVQINEYVGRIIIRRQLSSFTHFYNAARKMEIG